MAVEIEAKFTNVDPDRIRESLRQAGAELLQAETLMRRKVYDHPTNKQNDWFRVRDEGNKITLSYKKLNDRSLHGTHEVTLVVNDFDEACALLEGAQLQFKSYQETKRETWQLGNTEITIDTWPWIPPLVEIEGPSETAVREAANTLGLDWSLAQHGSVETAYMEHYEVTEKEIDDWLEIVFSPVPDWLEVKRKK